MHREKQAPGIGKNILFRIADFRAQIELSAATGGSPALHLDFLLHRHEFPVIHLQSHRDGSNSAQPICLCHGFVEERGNQSTVSKAGGALILRRQFQRAGRRDRCGIVMEHKTQALTVIGAAGEAAIFRAPVLFSLRALWQRSPCQTCTAQEPNAVGPFGIALSLGLVLNLPCIFTFMYTRNMMK